MRYLLIFILLFCWSAFGQEWEFSADSFTNERELQTTIAEGNVVIEQVVGEGRRRLEADKVIYNIKDNLVTATGSVRLWDEKESFYTADYFEVSGDFKHAIIEGLELRLKDYGRLTSDSAKRDEHLSIFRNASYSACEVCADSGDLLWELQANKVIHNEEEQVLKYYDTRLLFGGVPIFYMPYFEYPDPTVKRRSGFLLPSFGSNRNIGLFASLPYFLLLGERGDLTVNPIFTSKGGQIASGIFRYNLPRSSINVEASYTESAIIRGSVNNSIFDKNTNRWHVDIESLVHYNDLWRGGFDYQRASDRNYFRRYPFWEDRGNFLRSRVYAERFDSRDYINLSAYSFQDLRLEDSLVSPRVFPTFDAYFYGDRDERGGVWSTYSNLRFLDKSNLVDDRRIYSRGTYELPHYFSSGLVMKSNFSLYGSIKSTDYSTSENSFGQTIRDDESARVLPQAGVVFRYPLRRRTSSGTQIIEPIVATYLSPTDVNNGNLENSDASFFVLDSHNIFLAHRFNGVDRFDSGQRVAYGVNFGNYSDDIILRGFLGQSYEFSEDGVLKNEVGLRKGASDIILSSLAQYDTRSYFGIFNIDNQVKVDNSDYKVNRYFLQSSIGDDSLKLQSNYLFSRPGVLENATESQKQGSFAVDKRLDKYWRTAIFATFDWGEKAVSSSNTRRYGASFTYDDECFNFQILGSRDFSRNADLKDGFSFLINFSLKTLTGLTGGGQDSITTLSRF